MACGCPVVASTAPAIAEVAGDAAILVPSEDAAGFAAAMRRMRDPAVKANYARKGLERATFFSWRHAASMFVKAVCGVIGGEMGRDNVYLEKKLDKE